MSAPVELLAPEPAGASGILTPEALAFVADLHTHFASRRDELLARRAQRAAEIAKGAQLGFLPETASIRSSDWSVAPAPADLNDRRCEITGPGPHSTGRFFLQWCCSGTLWLPDYPLAFRRWAPRMSSTASKCFAAPSCCPSSASCSAAWSGSSPSARADHRRPLAAGLWL